MSALLERPLHACVKKKKKPDTELWSHGYDVPLRMKSSASTMRTERIECDFFAEANEVENVWIVAARTCVDPVGPAYQ